ncbi:MAG: hypothetical protein QF449_17495, partial [Alphaproteobacteria bacterium]|nr:hypothetical protein [Alphaproteobacteria bacterium]
APKLIFLYFFLMVFSGVGVVWSLPRARVAALFQIFLLLKHGRVVEDGDFASVDKEGTAFRELMENE